MTVFLFLLAFPGPGIDEHFFTPGDQVFEVQPVLPQWLKDRIRIWQNEADFLELHRDRILNRPDVKGEWLNPKLS